MNQKGLYSGGIALATIVLVIAISFNIASTVQAGESQGKADAILDAKWEIQNMWHVFEAAAVDAIVDTINHDLDCEYEENDVGPAVISSIMAQSQQGQGNCIVSNVVYASNPPGALIEIGIYMECENSIGPDLEVIYAKTIELKKKVTASGSFGSCDITVENTAGPPRLFGYDFP